MAPSPTARLNQHAVGVSLVKRGKWIQAACKHNIGRGREEGGDSLLSSVEKKISLGLDLEGKDRGISIDIVSHGRPAHWDF